jgi:hypothetical protein
MKRKEKQATTGAYDYQDTFLYGIAVVGKNGKFGYIAEKRVQITPLKYEEAVRFYYIWKSDSYLGRVRIGDKWGCIDIHGNEIIPLKYDELNISRDFRWFPARIGNKWGFIGDNGELTPFEYDDAKSFHNNRACVVKNGKYGFIDEKGEVVIPLIYDECEPHFRSEYNKPDAPIYMKRNGKYGYIDINGKEIVPPMYEHAYSFSCDHEMAAVITDGKVGFVNAAGREVIACQYEPDFSNSYNYMFKDDFANVKLNGKWGVIDTNNRVAAPFQYDEPIEDILDIFSVEELEHLAINGKYEKMGNVLQTRKRKLDSELRWTPENIEKLLVLDSKFISCFEKMTAEAISIYETLDERIKNNDAFLQYFNLDMKVTPSILVPDAEGELAEPEEGIYQVLMENLPKFILSKETCGDLDSDMDKNMDYFADLYLDKSHNWSEYDGLRHGELSKYYISYAIHDLHHHTLLSIPDILKINQLWSEVTVCHQNNVEDF